LSEDIDVNIIPARVHGRYLLRGPRGEDMPLLVGFHGYAEDARTHLEALQRIPGSENWLLCAVQALHPFYRGRSSDVVASWMTKLDRELAIEDNVRYVGDVIRRVREEHATSGVLAIIGFSQGVAMAWRAATRAGLRCDALVALAGDVPPELPDTPGLAWPPALIGRGTGDPWYTEDKLADDLETLRALGVSVEDYVFDGGHEWSPQFLERAGSFLERTRLAG
jgi:predicted esterase